MKCYIETRFEFEIEDTEERSSVDGFADAVDVANDVLDAGTFQDAVTAAAARRDWEITFSSSLMTGSGMIEDAAPPAIEVEVDAKNNMLDDDTRFVVDVLSIYGNTQANDVVSSDGMSTARRLATAIKAGTLLLVFHDDLEELAARLLKLKGLTSLQVMPERGVDDVEWTVSITGDGWDIQDRARTLTEAVNNVIERHPEEGEARNRAFAHRCRKLGLPHHDAYLLALDAGLDVSPLLWNELWQEAAP